MKNQFCGQTRREHLWQWGAGFTGLALSGLLQDDGFFKAQAADDLLVSPLAPKIAHLPKRAKHCIFLFMYGGPSQMDLFDYKPELQKRDGEKVIMEIRRRSMQDSTLLGSKRKFEQHGESGQWCSDALPHIAQHMDKLAVIKSLYMDSFAHGSAMLQMTCGRIIQGSPSIGSWLNYGLGSLNENLPGFLVMLDPRGGPISGTPNWGAGYMPAAYQGTVFRTGGEAILNLDPTTHITGVMRREQIEAINTLNHDHLAARPGYSELQARIASYELAFQLQRTAPEAIDLSRETHKTKEMYGLYDPKPNHKLAVGPAPFARQCIIARRLVERGVCFVQIFHGVGTNSITGMHIMASKRISRFIVRKSIARLPVC